MKSRNPSPYSANIWSQFAQICVERVQLYLNSLGVTTKTHLIYAYTVVTDDDTIHHRLPMKRRV